MRVNTVWKPLKMPATRYPSVVGEAPTRAIAYRGNEAERLAFSTFSNLLGESETSRQFNQRSDKVVWLLHFQLFSLYILCKTCFIPTCGMMSSFSLMLLEPVKARVSCISMLFRAVVFQNPMPLC
jgi:hypothetical protein